MHTPTQNHPRRLSAHPDGYLVTEDGQPFFYLADTVWMAFPNLTLDEWARYLAYRRMQGFTALQISILPVTHDTSMSPENVDPFLPGADGNWDFSAYNEAYFAKAETMVQMAVEHGFVPVLGVLWCSYVPGTRCAEHSPVASAMPFAAVAPYATYVAERFKRFDPIFFISGDTYFEAPEEARYYMAALEAVRAVCPAALRSMHLHPWGDVPRAFMDAVDFYMYQSGHGATEQHQPYTFAEKFAAYPIKRPVLNSEPPYEGHGRVGTHTRFVTAVGTKDDLRREAQASFTVQPGKDENGNRLPDDWEREYGVDDPNDDPDGDNLTTGCEFQLGTNPVNPDTDGGGESDGSEVPGCKPDPNGQDPLDPSDDRVGPITGIFVKPELLRTIPVIHVKWGSPLRGRLQYVNIYRRVFGPGGQLEQDWQFLKEAVEGDEFIDDDVEPGFGFQYRVVPFIQGEDGRTIVIGGILESPVGLPSGDPYAPSGSILINNGDEATTSRQVTLTFSADDLNAEHDGDNSQHPGSPVDKLEMRISNRADFAGSDWQPFQGEVSGWDLGSVAPGAVATVHVQFRDEAGNVSEVGLGLTDTIVYAPEMQEHILYLPVVIR